jgi:hypothetical protein
MSGRSGSDTFWRAVGAAKCSGGGPGAAQLAPGGEGTRALEPWVGVP